MPRLTSTATTAEKRELRRRMKLRRAAALAAAGGERLSGLVCAAVRASELFAAALTVAAYLAFNDEIDLAPLFDDAEKCFVVPRVVEPGGDLAFHALEPAALAPHRYGYLEPAASTPQVASSDIDLVMVPGLAFDARGGRLGYGGGHYDRFLLSLPSTTPSVGVTLDALLLDDVPREEHDVRVTHLVTESGLRPVDPD